MRKYLILTLATIVASLSQLGAQTLYNLQLPYQDSVEVSESNYQYREGVRPKHLKLGSGEELLILTDKEGKRRIKRGGVEYHAPSKHYLYYSENNKAGAVDILEGEDLCPNTLEIEGSIISSWRSNDEIGQLLYSYTAHLWVVGLLAVMLLLMFIDKKMVNNPVIRTIVLFATPILLLAVIAIETTYLLFMGGGVAWWVDPDHAGYFQSIIIGILTAYALSAQFGVFFFYKGIIAEGRDIAIKPLFVALQLPIPAMIVTAIAGVTFFKEYYNANDDMINIATLAITFGGAILYGMVKNISSIGFVRGFLFSIFSFVFAVGASIMLVMLAIVAFKVLIVIIVPIVVAIGMIIFFGTLAKSGALDSPRVVIIRK